MKLILFLLTALIVFTACRENYTCACTDAKGNTTDVFVIRDRRKKAQSKCESYGGQVDSLVFDKGSCHIK